MLSILPELAAGGSMVRQRGQIQDVAGAPLTVNRVSQTVGFGTAASGAGTYAVPGASMQFHIGNAVFSMLSAKQDRRAAEAAVSPPMKAAWRGASRRSRLVRRAGVMRRGRAAWSAR